MWYITWLGTLWNSAVPDLMRELRSVVIHVDHIDHDINGVLYLVAIQIHCMSSQLEETNTSGLWNCSSQDDSPLFQAYTENNYSLNVTHLTKIYFYCM